MMQQMGGNKFAKRKAKKNKKGRKGGGRVTPKGSPRRSPRQAFALPTARGDGGPAPRVARASRLGLTDPALELTGLRPACRRVALRPSWETARTGMPRRRRSVPVEH